MEILKFNIKFTLYDIRLWYEEQNDLPDPTKIF